MSVITMILFAVVFIARGWLGIWRPAWSTRYKAWKLKHEDTPPDPEYILTIRRIGWLYLILGCGILAYGLLNICSNPN